MQTMSFMLTRTQILAQTKFVTRRNGWLNLMIGDVVQPVHKRMGLKLAEKVQKLGPPIVVLHVRREPLHMLYAGRYGAEECILEGFPDLTPSEFIAMYCASHRGTTVDSVVTRIWFDYLPKKVLAFLTKP